jgi:molecular chaperone DnaJ
MEFAMKDYYAILEIPPDASLEHIKEQRHFLIQAWHPDKFSNPAQKAKAEEKTKEINEAYSVLKDPQKRAAYNAAFFYQSPKPAKQQEASNYDSQRTPARKQTVEGKTVNKQTKHSRTLTIKKIQLRKIRKTTYRLGRQIRFFMFLWLLRYSG